MITEAQLRAIMPNLSAGKLTLYLPFLNAAMQANGVDNLLRTAAFIAQLAHESGEFRFMEELWGPIAAQLRYEPQTDLSKKLGNTLAGDGKRFKGRGPIQITGRFNYQKYGQLLDIDLVATPEQAAMPDVAFLTAGLFWRSNGLNELADGEQFVTITKRINGGTNGLDDRQQYYAPSQDGAGRRFPAFPGDAGWHAPAGTGRAAVARLRGDPRGDRRVGAGGPASLPSPRPPRARRGASPRAEGAKSTDEAPAAKKAAARESIAAKATPKKKAG